MEKKRILFVTQEMKPYTDMGEMSDIVNQITQYVSANGYEIRVLMPRFGTINERRHRLHEVVRLSGMNIIVDDDDFPLIIKVASLPGSRMQVYFLDNEEFFKRKYIFKDAAEAQFDDNLDRMVFYSKGSIETVKKFGWVPDIIHCHGWMTAFVPLYVKHLFNDDPHFEDAKLVFTAYDDPAENLNKDMAKKLTQEGFPKDLLKSLAKPTTEDLSKFAMGLCDAVTKGDPKLSRVMENAFKATDGRVLGYTSEEERVAAHAEFYHDILEEALV